MTSLQRSMAGAFALFAIAQLAPISLPAPGAGKQKMEAVLDVPPHVQNVLQKACRNCHSNETAWPWYARVAPMSWLMARDVTRARKAINFSEWQPEKPYVAIGALTAACAVLQQGRMPPPQYRMMHPEARLSKAEVEGFCRWTSVTAAKLRPQRGS